MRAHLAQALSVSLARPAPIVQASVLWIFLSASLALVAIIVTVSGLQPQEVNVLPSLFVRQVSTPLHQVQITQALVGLVILVTIVLLGQPCSFLASQVTMQMVLASANAYLALPVLFVQALGRLIQSVHALAAPIAR
jgi:hypothetical protein